MRVKMLTSTAGVPAYHDGQIVDLETRIAEAWIAEGIAVQVNGEDNAIKAPTAGRER
jgi:hypothetical protein